MKNKILFIVRGFKISSNFKEKLNHNFHALTILEMIWYLIFIRPKWSGEKRFLFEGSFLLLGQMYVAERKLLYDTILMYKPRHCFEIGTYTGGGSTYFIAKAFEHLHAGKLITMEIDPYYYNKAKDYYKNNIPKVGARVEFILGSTPEMFDAVIQEYKSVDCIFLDGAEESGQTLSQYEYFLPHFHSGTILMVHDWNTEKTRTLKPILLNDTKWKLVQELHPPVSVGMAVFEML